MQDERAAGARTAGEERSLASGCHLGRCGELLGGEEGLERNRAWILQDFQALT